MSMTLPKELAEMVKVKVATGEHASDSEVIREGLRTLVARDRALETWLCETVVPAYDRMRADPSRGLTIHEVRDQLGFKTGSP